MNTDEHGYLDSLTERVLGAVFEVSHTLGAGFLEKVYQHALMRELALRSIRASAQASLAVTYKGHHVGEYFADILVEDVLVVELKCVDRLANQHTAQCSIICGPPTWACASWSISKSPKSNGSASFRDSTFLGRLRHQPWQNRHA